MIVTRIEPSKWSEISEDAHRVVFNETRPAHFDRISYALVVGTEEEPMAYITVRETDKESAYIQYGGAFPNVNGSVRSFRIFSTMMAWLKNFGYKRVNMLVEGSNKVMLKFALSMDFDVIGMRVFNGTPLLELMRTF